MPAGEQAGAQGPPPRSPPARRGTGRRTGAHGPPREGSLAPVNSADTHQGVSTLGKLLRLPARQLISSGRELVLFQNWDQQRSSPPPQTPRLAASQNYRDAGSKVAI